MFYRSIFLVGISGLVLYALLSAYPIGEGIGQLDFFTKAGLFLAFAGFIASSAFALGKLTK